MSALAAVGVDMDEVTENLKAEGVEKFKAAWNDLLASIAGALART